MSYTSLKRDECKIGAFTDAADSPYPDGTYVYGPAKIPCRFAWKTTREVGAAENVTQIDAEIRLHKGTTIAHESRIELTRLDRVDQSPSLFFEVVGVPRITKGQILCKCVSIDGAQAN